MGPPLLPPRSERTRLCSISGAACYTMPRRSSVNLLGRDSDVAARRLRRRQRVLGAHEQQLARLLAIPARHAGGGGLPPRRRRAHAIEHLDGLAEPAARQDESELDAFKARQHVDLAQLGTPARRGLLDEPVALALAAQHVERA